VAPALDAGAVQADQRVALTDPLHEGVAALVRELGEIAQQEIAEHAFERAAPGVGVPVVVAGDDHQEPRGDEGLEERAGDPQLLLVTQGGQVTGDDDPIRSEREHLVDEAGDAPLDASEPTQTSQDLELEAPRSAAPARAPEGTLPPVDLLVEVTEMGEAKHDSRRR
jgi:hypothetical protein